jgi:hypothetical protein
LSILAEVRRFFPLKSGKGDIEVRATHLESLAVDPVAPDGLELTRGGRRFVWGPQNGVTGIAPVAALPTTAAQWVLWNGDQNQAYVIDQLGALLVSGTAAAGLVLLACLFQQPVQSGASVVGMQISSASTGYRTSKGLLKSAVTVTQPATPTWFPVAKGDSANTGVLSVAAENRDLRGRIIVPPNAGLGLCVLSGAGTTPLFAPFGMHTEIELDLE